MIFKFNENLKKWTIFALIIEDKFFTDDVNYVYIHPTLRNAYFWHEDVEGVNWGCWIGKWHICAQKLDTKFVCPD